MKKLIAVLLVLLVASAFVFAVTKTCDRCKTTYNSDKDCPYCYGSNRAYQGLPDDCGNAGFFANTETKEAQCHDGYWDAKNKMSGSTSASEE